MLKSENEEKQDNDQFNESYKKKILFLTDKIKNVLVSRKVGQDIKSSLSEWFEFILKNVDDSEADDHLQIIMHFIVQSLQWFRKTGITEVESEFEDTSESISQIESITEYESSKTEDDLIKSFSQSYESLSSNDDEDDSKDNIDISNPSVPNKASNKDMLAITKLKLSKHTSHDQSKITDRSGKLSK